MKFQELKSLFEARDQNENRLFKYCTFEWILDLLKNEQVHSYQHSLRDQKIEPQKNDEKSWIALTTKRSSNINQHLEEYGPCEITFDKELLKISNDVYTVRFTSEWLDKRPSISKFITKGKYKSSADYFKKHAFDVNWNNTDNYSKKFFDDYIIDGDLDIDLLLIDYPVSEIEDYIYDTDYLPFENYLNSLGEDDELVVIDSPLKLVNDSVLQIIVPRRYKDKINQFENEYKIRYE